MHAGAAVQVIAGRHMYFMLRCHARTHVAARAWLPVMAGRLGGGGASWAKNAGSRVSGAGAGTPVAASHSAAGAGEQGSREQGSKGAVLPQPGLQLILFPGLPCLFGSAGAACQDDT